MTHVLQDSRARASQARAWATVAVVYVACVGGLLGIAKMFEAGRPQLTAFVLMRLLFLLTALLAFAMLGRHDIARVFGRVPTRLWLAIGPAVGLVVYGINCLWVLVSSRMQGVTMPYVSGDVTVWTVLAAPILVAYTEELVFRGVLWTALERVSRSKLKPLLQTSVLFALVHLVNRGGLWELPHRFVAGLLLGYLRMRSESLLPSVHAHFVVLALATVD